MTGPGYDALLQAARDATKLAYAPYSGLRVGAAALIESGNVVLGCNIENAAYAPTICAERVAVFSARAQGKRRGGDREALRRDVRAVRVVPAGAVGASARRGDRAGGRQGRLLHGDRTHAAAEGVRT
jgi:cytidine deaminase